MLDKILRMAGNRKIRLGSSILKVAACFIDYESEHLPPDSRIVEDSFVFSKLMNRPSGKALDVGCIARHNVISPSLALNKWIVYGVDIRSEWQFHHPNFNFLQEDIRKTSFPDDYFDLVSCVSTLEHIGLVGYYGNRDEVEHGDAEALQQIKRILKSQGTLLLTVPYCDNYFSRPGCRVYSLPVLMEMLDGFALSDKLIYLQDKKGDWNTVTHTSTEGVICLELIKN